MYGEPFLIKGLQPIVEHKNLPLRLSNTLVYVIVDVTKIGLESICSILINQPKGFEELATL